MRDTGGELADHGELLLHAQALTQVLVRLEGLLVLQGLVDGGGDLLRAARLGEHVERAEAHEVHGALDGAVARQHHRHRCGALGLQGDDQLAPRHRGHRQVGQHDLGRVLSAGLQGFDARGHRAHPVAGDLQDLSEEVPHHRLVVHDDHVGSAALRVRYVPIHGGSLW